MRILIVLLFLIAARLPLDAAAAFVTGQATSGSDTSGNYVTTLTTSNFASSVTAGNLLIVGVYGGNSTGSTITVSDTLGNSFAAATAQVSVSGQPIIQMFYGVITTGGTDAVTASMSSGGMQYAVVIAQQYSGLATSSVLDVPTSASGATGAVATSAVTTTQSGDLAVAIAYRWGGDQLNAAGTGYTQRQTLSTVNNAGFEDQVLGAAGSYTSTFGSTGTTTGWGSIMATFKPLGAAANVQPARRFSF